MNEECPNEMAFPGLHNKVMDVITKLDVDKNSKILVLGSGEGGVEKKLLDAGYKNIVSVDYYTEFKLNEKLMYFKLDLNKNNFAEEIKSKTNMEFDLIISVEIIEHLYSTFNFLENVKKLLKRNGNLMITTPNVHSFLARIDYLTHAEPTYFIHKPELGGHVNPIFENILLHFLDILDLKIVEKEYWGSFLEYVNVYDKRTLRSKIYMLGLLILYIPMNPFMILNRDKNKGISTIYVISFK